MTVQVVRSKRDLLAVRAARHPNAVVMTMGALHEGHASLIRRARELAGASGQVLVTIFVNPLQFGPNEDFARYPRTFDADVALCQTAGADVVFAPDVAEMYADDAAQAITIAPGALGEILEGQVRPGHFGGMLTVVNKLLNLTAADLAVFGEKDYQQLTLIRRMVADLDLPVQIVPVETVREDDGLAMSSRNRYLSQVERALAALVPQALRAVVEAAPGRGVDAAVAAGLAVLDCEGISVDYLTVTDPLLGPVRAGEGRALVAVRIGSTRLIDNMACQVGAQ